MVLGAWMRGRAGSWVEGLGAGQLCRGASPLPRVGPRQSATLRSNLPYDVAILGIGEATSCLSTDGGRWKVIGENTVEVIGPTARQEYRDGQDFALLFTPD